VEDLYQKHCETCQLGESVIAEEEANRLILAIPAWKKGFHEGVEKLTREFHFIEFSDAFKFSYKIAAMAEREDHHPAITTAWGKVTVYWWTHKINGLHTNDFIMAAKTDMIAKLSATA
jgi:4a-hydroxytetrahydrobiopterin dehydratase|tara:strand:- start:362 stop:715 length:354 start_codon:yes stop_codon:yes gene_type:complete